MFFIGLFEGGWDESEWSGFYTGYEAPSTVDLEESPNVFQGRARSFILSLFSKYLPHAWY